MPRACTTCRRNCKCCTTAHHFSTCRCIRWRRRWRARIRCIRCTRRMSRIRHMACTPRTRTWCTRRMRHMRRTRHTRSTRRCNRRSRRMRRWRCRRAARVRRARVPRVCTTRPCPCPCTARRRHRHPAHPILAPPFVSILMCTLYARYNIFHPPLTFEISTGRLRGPVGGMPPEELKNWPGDALYLQLVRMQV